MSLGIARAWNDFWFPERSAVPLAVARIWLVALVLWMSLPPLGQQLTVLESWDGFREPQVVVTALGAVVSPELVRDAGFLRALTVATCVAGAFALVGFRTRLACAGVAVGHGILVAHLYSYGEAHHRKCLLAIVLLTLPFSDAGRSLSVDSWLRAGRGASLRTRLGLDERSRFVRFPVQLLWVLLGLVYLDGAYRKLSFGGLDWLNGYTIQNYALMHAMLKERVAPLWLASHHGVAMLASYATIAIEGGFVLAIFVRALRPLFWLGGLGLHVGLDLFFYEANGLMWITWTGLYLVLLGPDVWDPPRAGLAQTRAALGGLRARHEQRPGHHRQRQHAGGDEGDGE